MKKQNIFVILIFCVLSFSAFAADDAIAPPSSKAVGNMTFLSHFVEKGITQSNYTPAIQGSFWYSFGPLFRLGLWGSNTNYNSDSDLFNIRVNADLKIVFTATAHAVVSYSNSTYLRSGDHNGNITDINLTFPGFHVIYTHLSNWQGYQSASTRYAFNKPIYYSDGWQWDTEVGYNNVDLTSIPKYFDMSTGVGKKISNVLVETKVTATSDSSSLKGLGDTYFVLALKTDF